MPNNKDYWNEYYSSHHHYMASDFAKWAVSTYPRYFKKKGVVDICCGDGRDSFFLGNYCESVLGLDQVSVASPGGNVDFTVRDIARFATLDSLAEKYSVMYCRFGLHAIEESNEDIILGMGFKSIFIECRSTLGVKPDHTHYRRLINSETLIGKLNTNGYVVDRLIEDVGLASTETEDPVIIRLVASKDK